MDKQVFTTNQLANVLLVEVIINITNRQMPAQLQF